MLLQKKKKKKENRRMHAKKKNETNAPRLCPTPVLAIYDATNMRDDQIFIIII
jgi:hypothetical protein